MSASERFRSTLGAISLFVASTHAVGAAPIPHIFEVEGPSGGGVDSGSLVDDSSRLEADQTAAFSDPSTEPQISGVSSEIVQEEQPVDMTWPGFFLNGDSVRHPYLTGDGSRVVFQPFIAGARNIWIIDTDGTDLRRVTDHPTVFDPGGFKPDGFPSISDDGNRIVFQSEADPLGTNSELNAEIFTVKADGTELRQITSTETGAGFAPCISGDGTKICFQYRAVDLTGENPDLNSEFYVANFDGSGLVQVSDSPEGVSGAMSRDGSTVIWGPSGFGENTLYRASPDGASTTPLVTLNEAFVLSRYAVTNDGSIAVFRSNDDPFGTNTDGNNEIFILDVDTGDFQQLTETVDAGGLGNANLRPLISGNGSLVFLLTQNDLTGANPDFGSELFIVCPEGGSIKQITRSDTDPIPTNASQFDVSLDDRGDMVAVVSGHDFSGQMPGVGAFTLWVLDSTEPDSDGDGRDDACPVPEPASDLLGLSALTALGLLVRRRRGV